MGAWHYLTPLLFELASGSLTVGYIGRPTRSSPSGGNPHVHKKGQEHIIHQTLYNVHLPDSLKPKKVLVKN